MLEMVTPENRNPAFRGYSKVAMSAKLVSQRRGPCMRVWLRGRAHIHTTDCWRGCTFWKDKCSEPRWLDLQLGLLFLNYYY